MRFDIKKTRLALMADIQTGPFGSQLHKEDYVTNGTPIVTVEHLGKRRFAMQNLPYVSDEDCIRLDKYRMLEGDVVFSRVGSVDRCSYAFAENNGWLFSGRCLRVRACREIDPLYLYYYLNSEAIKRFVRNIAVGATMPSINTKLMGKIPLLYPSIKEQRNMVRILSVIDDKIERNIAINKNLEEQARAIFDLFYSRAVEKVPFTQLIKVLGGGTPKTTEGNFWNGDIPFFTPKDIGAPYSLRTEKYITEAGLANCNSRLYPVNTTFVTARGTVGKVSLAGVPMAINQSCYALANDEIHPLLTYFYTLNTVRSLRHKATGAVFDAIITADFERELLNKLSSDESSQVLSHIVPMMESIHKNSIEIAHLSELRDALLPRLMSGELDVSSIEI